MDKYEIPLGFLLFNNIASLECTEENVILLKETIKNCEDSNNQNFKEYIEKLLTNIKISNIRIGGLYDIGNIYELYRCKNMSLMFRHMITIQAHHNNRFKNELEYMHFQVNNNTLYWTDEMIASFNLFYKIVKEFCNQLTIMDKIVHLYNGFLSFERTSFESLKLRILNSVFMLYGKIKSKFILELNDDLFRSVFIIQKIHYQKMHYQIFNEETDNFWSKPENPRFIDHIYSHLLYDGLTDNDDNKFYHYISKSLFRKYDEYLQVNKICFENYCDMKTIHKIIKYHIENSLS